MTCLYSDRHRINHPLKILNQPLAGYILDLVREFERRLGWGLDQDSLHGLLLLAGRHLPGLKSRSSEAGSPPSFEALLGRLLLAGDLGQSEQGLVLTPRGKDRCRTIFRVLLAAPEWRHTLERIGEDLTVFAETDGLPLEMIGFPGVRQAGSQPSDLGTPLRGW